MFRFFLASADPARGEREQRAVLGALLYTPESPNKIGQYFYNKTRELITANSFSLVGGKSRCVDVVRHVLRHVPVYWAATEIVSLVSFFCISAIALFKRVLGFLGWNSIED
jgi:hypothetical protein